jgi:hypothetical protein
MGVETTRVSSYLRAEGFYDSANTRYTYASAVNNLISGLTASVNATYLNNVFSGLSASANASMINNIFSGLASTVTAGLITSYVARAVTSDASVSANYSASAGSVGLTTSMWNDIIIPGVSLGKGASVPDLVTQTGNILLYGFDGAATLEQLYGTFEMQHDYKEGTDIRPHIHWTASDTSTGYVLWQLEYSYANTSAGFTTATTITASGYASGTANSHLKNEFTVIPGSGIEVGDIITFRLYRDPTATADTYTSDALLLNIGIHYEVSSLGSINIFGN